MSVSEKNVVAVTRHLQNLRGNSQPFLAEASDGHLYAVKFLNNPQGANLLFNESAGSELYRACKLPVPAWKPLLLTEAFLDANPECWMRTAEGRMRPEPGMCFGSRYLGAGGGRLLEILPGNHFCRVRNRNVFWLAWLVDICAGHTDNRQAVFQEDAKGHLHPFFLDHGHLFGGPKGEQHLHFQASRYLDARIYRSVSSQQLTNFLRIARCIDVERLRQAVRDLPDNWKTESAQEEFALCLGRLSNPTLLQNILDTMVDALRQVNEREQSKPQFERKATVSVLCPGVSGARIEPGRISGCASHLACA
jgi:hypothetical protein